MTTIPVLRAFALAAGLTLAATAVAGCEEDGPAEQLGEKVDDAARSAGEKAEEAGDAVRDATN